MDKKVDAKIIQVGIVPQVGVLQLDCECDPSTMRIYILNDDLKLRPLKTDYSCMIKKDFVVLPPMTVGERVLLEYSKSTQPPNFEKRVGVLVKDMEMPSECNYCGFCRYYEYGRVWCNAKNKILREYWEDSNMIRSNIERPDWCPLEEVEVEE